MKTFSKFFTYAAIAAFAFSSCTPEKLKNDNLNEGKTVTVHFGAETTDPSSKATLTPNDGETAFQAAWENGDEILISYSFDNQTPTTTTGTWKSNSFEANLPAGNGYWVYEAAYPVPANDNSLEFGSNRTQKGNAYNSKYDIMIGSASAKNAAAGKDDSGNDIIFKMDRQTAIAYFHFTSELDEAITSATLTVSGDDAAIASSSAYITDFAWAANEDCQSITITFPEEAPNAQNFQLWFNVLPTDYESMSLTVETETKTFTISKSSEGTYEAGKLYKVKKENIAWTVTDVITADKLAATSTKYTDFSGKTFTSSAVYAGNSAKNSNGYIQLRSSESNSGIVSTTSGGKVTKVSVEWGSDTANGRIVEVYGNTNPYTSASNLYSIQGNTNQGSKIGTIVCGTSTELVIVGNYPYVGIRSSQGAIYLNSVSITWESGSSEPAPDTYSVNCATVTGGTLSATPSQAEAGADITLTATPNNGYTFNNDWTVINAKTSEKIDVQDGKFTMPAANVTVSASFTQTGAGAGNVIETIDFEAEDFSASYTGWTFTNLSRANAITAKAGSYYATNSSSTTASVQTKNKIASPKSLKCYYSKSTTNTNNSSKFIIQVSSDGKNWTNVSTGSTMNNVEKGTWYELFADLTSYSNVYVRVYYSGTNTTRCLDEIEFIYK